MISLLAILAASSVANADIRTLLREQGFNGLVNGRETIRFAGNVRQGRNDYKIYTYHGVFKAAVVDHGVNWIIVVLNGSVVLGGYQIPMPTRCRVHRDRVFCDAKSLGRVIHFTKRGPRRQIWFDGEVQQFQRSN